MKNKGYPKIIEVSDAAVVRRLQPENANEEARSPDESLPAKRNEYLLIHLTDRKRMASKSAPTSSTSSTMISGVKSERTRDERTWVDLVR